MQVASPALLLKALGSMIRGNYGSSGGDVMQMPGTFVIDRAGTLRLCHYNRTSADNATTAEILAVV